MDNRRTFPSTKTACSHFYVAVLHAWSTIITEKMAVVQFPSNALRSKIFMKANGCKRMDVRQEIDLFILLQYLIIRWSCAVFIQNGNAFWENVHTAIFSLFRY